MGIKITHTFSSEIKVFSPKFSPPFYWQEIWAWNFYCCTLLIFSLLPTYAINFQIILNLAVPSTHDKKEKKLIKYFLEIVMDADPNTCIFTVFVCNYLYSLFKSYFLAKANELYKGILLVQNFLHVLSLKIP